MASGARLIVSIANAATADFGFVPFGSAETYNSNAFEMYTWEGNFQCNYGVMSLHISSAKLNTKAKFLFDKGNIKIEYSDQTVEVQYKATTVNNVRQKATVTVEKANTVKTFLWNGMKPVNY